ncbi:AAA family ATPase [Fusobacterium necrophorum]|uniref:AAA family ATPase n=1 Tax=Fusobacterium necrophorum TaxID=859 RepID=UPI00254BF915|nr:AAA family ATPase [Fusobacterium necrophorum]MDK4504726.1 ATP-binding protein [Fusobacterium necrophorum]
MSKKIPIGISNFKVLRENGYYYFDKTKFIESIIEEFGKSFLFTRPRRFGKTLNMSMLKYFFDIVNAEENRNLFKDLYIEKTDIFRCQGQYPVIYISLKDLKLDSFEEMIEELKNLIAELYEEHLDTLENLSSFNRDIFNNILTRNTNMVELRNSLKFLSKILKDYYGKNIILIIDEYDTPIVSAYEYGYYEEAITFFRPFLSSVLKDNEYLQMGVMTGILRVAKEGIFSGLNNLSVYTILDNDYSEFFGLTEMEVEKSLIDYQMDYRMDDVKEWYDGYKFGDSEIYNPWSILNFLSSKKLESYWINTSDNYLIKKILNNSDDILIEELRELFNYQFLEKSIDKSSNMVDLRNKKEIWQLLLFSGYVTIEKKTETTPDSYSLKIVNKEVHNFFKKTFVDSYLADESLFTKMMISLFEKNLEAFEKFLQKILLLSFSYYDGAKEEKFYHNLILGMILYLDRRYKVCSNKEIGLGRYDIVLEPKHGKGTAYIFEFKVAKTSEELEDKAKEALEQIRKKKYDVDLKEKGYNILYVGMAFCGKEVKVKYL